MAQEEFAEFQRLLDHSAAERNLAAHLRAHAWIMFWAMCATGGHDEYVLSEFPLGNEYVADFVVLQSYSYTWEIYFVELEAANDPVFNKDGTPGKRLAVATRQVDSWRAFIEQNSDLVRRDLVRYAKRRDRLGYSCSSEPCNYTGDYLADPRTRIQFKYRIVIGRSSKLSPEVRGLMGRYQQNHVELMSYDRLLRVADRHTKADGD